MKKSPQSSGLTPKQAATLLAQAKANPQQMRKLIAAEQQRRKRDQTSN